MKLNRIFNLLAFTAITAIVLLASCARESSDSVDQDKIYTEYELFYNENEDKTYARATFRFSNITGTKLELTEPSEVTFNGDPLTWKSALAYYEKEYAGFVDNGMFKWIDLDGNVFENTIEVHTIDFPAGLDSLDKSGAFELNWVGDSLWANENVTVTVNGIHEGDAQVFVQDDIASTSLIMGTNQLQNLGDGQGTIYMDRNYLPELTQQTSRGGYIKGRYRPVNRVVEIH